MAAASRLVVAQARRSLRNDARRRPDRFLCEPISDRKGHQPYSQPIIEALAAALGVTVPMLLESDPAKEGEIIDLLQQLTPTKRREAIAIIQALSKAS